MDYLMLAEMNKEELGTSPYGEGEAAEKVINRYDPENDLLPGGPYVTWAEYELAEELRYANTRIKVLEQRIARLEAKLQGE